MADFDNRVAFITGAARGQGRATALALAKNGADIAAFDVGVKIEYPAYAYAAGARRVVRHPARHRQRRRGPRRDGDLRRIRRHRGRLRDLRCARQSRGLVWRCGLPDGQHRRL